MKRAPGKGIACLALLLLALAGLGAALLSGKPAESSSRDDRYLHALDAFNRGEFDRALSLLEPLDDARSHHLAARAATALGQPLRAATHLLKVLEKEPGDYPATLALASAYKSAGMEDLAISTYESATRLRPGDPAPWKAAGLLYADRGDVAMATACLLRAYELDPEDKDALLRMADLGRPRDERDRETFGGLGRMPASGVPLPQPPDPRKEVRR